MGEQSKFVDITGQTFNELTALEYLGDRMWKWRCSCGNECIARKNDVISGRKKSCGHLSNRGNANINPGDTFGEWTVLEFVGDRKYKCRCSCGNEGIVHSYDLRKGNSKSCGHLTKVSKINMGDTFGEWTVIDNGEKWGHHLCKCSCGTIKEVPNSHLLNGGSKSCGCKSNKFIDMTGEVYGEWTVKRFLGNYKWECECSCGTIKPVGRYDLISGKSTNCGCKRKATLEGNRYGKLTVVKYIGDNIWECKCDCGNITRALTTNLTKGNKLSCGCLQSDKNEQMLASIEAAIARYIHTKGVLPFPEEIAEDLGITPTTVNKYKKAHNLQHYFDIHFGSKVEKEIYLMIEDKVGRGNVESRNKTVLNGKELDIYIPSKNLAIEYNGDYWHSTEKLDSNYHQLKTIEAAKNGVRLIHIFEHEWNDLRKRELLINHINRLVEDNRNIEYCTHIKELNKEEAVKFLHKNAINILDSENYLGLYNISGDLIGITQINQDPNNRFTLTNIKIEIVNTIYKNNTNVVNGIEKIIKYLALKYNANTIYTRIDISKFTGKQYLKAGFKLIDIEIPKHIWINTIDSSIIQFNNINESILEKVEDLVKVEDCGYLRLAWAKE